MAIGEFADPQFPLCLKQNILRYLCIVQWTDCTVTSSVLTFELWQSQMASIASVVSSGKLRISLTRCQKVSTPNPGTGSFDANHDGRLFLK